MKAMIKDQENIEEVPSLRDKRTDSEVKKVKFMQIHHPYKNNQ